MAAPDNALRGIIHNAVDSQTQDEIVQDLQSMNVNTPYAIADARTRWGAPSPSSSPSSALLLFPPPSSSTAGSTAATRSAREPRPARTARLPATERMSAPSPSPPSVTAAARPTSQSSPRPASPAASCAREPTSRARARAGSGSSGTARHRPRPPPSTSLPHQRHPPCPSSRPPGLPAPAATLSPVAPSLPAATAPSPSRLCLGPRRPPPPPPPPHHRYAAWLDYSNRMDLAELPKEQVHRSQYLCSDHFTDGDYADPLKRKLLWSALPSVRVRSWFLTATDEIAKESRLAQGPDIGEPVDLQMAEKYSVSPEGTTEESVLEAVAMEHQLSLEPGPSGLQKDTSHDVQMERREEMAKTIRTGHNACCAAQWCENTGRNSNLKFFRFPQDDRCNKWRLFADREDLASLTPEEMCRGYRLCSEHFTDRDYMDPYKTRLLFSAVPSVKFVESCQKVLFLRAKVIPGVEASVAPSQDEPAGERVAAIDSDLRLILKDIVS
nr:serine/arginine repetitive matrix protein 1-like isoform X4 [Dermacentor andersoni]